MPKNRKIVKKNGIIYKFKVPATLRIGTRKNGISAHRMSTEALKEVMEGAKQKRWRNNARTVLALRGLAA